MKKYVWILDSDMAPYLKGLGGVSSSYVLPKAQAPRNPVDLAGGRAWMVLRGSKGDTLFAYLYIGVVEQFEDGLNIGDFSLTVALAKSYRCISSYNSAFPAFRNDKTVLLPRGMNEVDDDLFEELSSQARNAISVKLQRPTQLMLDRVSPPPLKGSIATQSEKIISWITSHFSLEEVWANGNRPKLPPFANLAYFSVAATRGEETANDMIAPLADADPTVPEIIPSFLKNKEASGRFSKPIVDLHLSPVDPDKIYARKFIARGREGLDLADVMEKTEHAEKRHQDMLREIAIRLRTIGFTPLQSSSIDLFVEMEDACATFELKTATAKSLLGQAAKGLFQLGCYRAALTDEGYGENNKLALIIEATQLEDLDSYVSRILNSFGIHILFYKQDLPWPDKVFGLEALLKGNEMEF